MEWIIIVLLITAALVPLIMWLSHIAQEKGWTIGRILNGKGGVTEMEQIATEYKGGQETLAAEGETANNASSGLNSNNSGTSFPESGK